MTAHSRYEAVCTGNEQEKELAHRLAHTWPGQASFVDPTSPHECRQCEFWKFNGYNGDRQLKQAGCKKASTLSFGRIKQKFPGDAKSCKYFVAGEDHPFHTGQDGDYRQVHGPDHLWRETRHSLREAEKTGHSGFKSEET